MAPGYSEQTQGCHNHNPWGHWNNSATTSAVTTSAVTTTGRDATWDSWNNSGSTTYTADSSETTWGNWNDDSTATPCHTHVGIDVAQAGVESSQVWYYWNSDTAEAPSLVRVEGYSVTHPHIKQKNHKERMKLKRRSKRRIALGNRRGKKARRKKVIADWNRGKADRRARQLLEDVLGKDQMEPFDNTGRVLVKGKKHDWIIGKNGMVKRVEKDKIVSICVHLIDGAKYPTLDKVVSFMLMAKYAEDYLKETGNDMGKQDLPKDLDQCAQM